jgi:hypothetical protein
MKKVICIQDVHPFKVGVQYEVMRKECGFIYVKDRYNEEQDFKEETFSQYFEEV